MGYFYINRHEQSNGDHEVHTDGCSHPPNILSRIRLGYFASSNQAVAFAKRQWVNKRINGCYYCCPESHTT